MSTLLGLHNNELYMYMKAHNYLKKINRYDSSPSLTVLPEVPKHDITWFKHSDDFPCTERQVMRGLTCESENPKYERFSLCT